MAVTALTKATIEELLKKGELKQAENQDVHLNVTGGLKINETGADCR